MSERIKMCKIVHFHGFQRPILRVHPAPLILDAEKVHEKVHDFAIRCMNFLNHFKHLICHIKHGADILARQMVFRGPATDVCSK